METTVNFQCKNQKLQTGYKISWDMAVPSEKIEKNF